ncbi:MAG: hypothetical protein ACKO56_05800 [Paracoccaceae bacterium]
MLKKRTTQSLCLELSQLRSQLQFFLARRSEGQPVTIEERKDVMSICSRILAVKGQLQVLDHNPNTVAARFSKETQKVNKKKTKRTNKNKFVALSGARHGGGVGMYGLGARIKIWR